MRAGVKCVCVCFRLKLYNFGAVLENQCNVFSREKENGKE